jgi:hypothetical protein
MKIRIQYLGKLIDSNISAKVKKFNNFAGTEEKVVIFFLLKEKTKTKWGSARDLKSQVGQQSVLSCLVFVFSCLFLICFF